MELRFKKPGTKTNLKCLLAIRANNYMGEDKDKLIKYCKEETDLLIEKRLIIKERLRIRNAYRMKILKKSALECAEKLKNLEL